LIWLLRDFDLLAVLLHAAVLSCEALLVGGVAFLLYPGQTLAAAPHKSCCRLMQWSAWGLIAGEAGTIVVTSASMLAGSGMTLPDLVNASFLRAEALTIALALLPVFFARRRASKLGMLLSALAVSASIVYLSHATSQMNHQVPLTILTGLHHLGTAGWIGAMPYLLLSLRDENAEQSRLMVRRFSTMALVSVPVLIGAGTGMAWFYVGSIKGLYGSSYGLMLLAKIYLLLLMLVLGSGNWFLHRRSASLPADLLLRLRRFSEAEIGLGFTVLLAAASMTSQSPASDMQPQDLVSVQSYRLHMWPVRPSLSSPPFRALTPPTSIRQGVEAHQFGEVSTNDANDDAWSNYNHHWAGLMVLVAGALALVSNLQWGRWARWARFWPLSFVGLALFILLRADPEAWPLGPRPFWASFSYPDVLEHRLEALLIVVFATFESAVQVGWLRKQWATLVFPLICALGAALLLTHSHGLGNASEVLAEASHMLIAVLGATAAWARWLQLRLSSGRVVRIAGAAWPVALTLVGVVLLNYREA